MKLDLRRPRAAEWIAAVGAVALLAALAQQPGAVVVRLLLLAVAVAGLAPVALAAVRRSPALPLAASVVGSVVGVVGVVLALVRLLGDPGTATWLGLAGTLAITAGCWLGVRDERAGRAPESPEPELRPTPPPEPEPEREPTAAN